jgi:thymidylate synthase ThyX
MLTIEWQSLGPSHGYDLPDPVVQAGVADRFHEAMVRSADLYHALEERFPASASYAVSLAYRVRYSMQLNAREAMHLLELRTGPQGHPAYRRIGQEMHRQIAEVAGHPTLASMMRHVDHGEPGLERLESERRAEARRQEA